LKLQLSCLREKKGKERRERGEPGFGCWTVGVPKEELSQGAGPITTLEESGKGEGKVERGSTKGRLGWKEDEKHEVYRGVTGSEQYMDNCWRRKAALACAASQLCPAAHV
jgi:hypothetical protein